LFSEPQILILDEPTTGLDPETRKMIWEVIQELQKKYAMTVFLTTHYMEEAANANHIIILNKGKFVAQGDPSSLKSKYSKDLLKIRVSDKKKLEITLKEEKKGFTKTGPIYSIEISKTINALSILNSLKDIIEDFEVVKGTLDDVFLKVIGGECDE